MSDPANSRSLDEPDSISAARLQSDRVPLVIHQRQYKGGSGSDLLDSPSAATAAKPGFRNLWATREVLEIEWEEGEEGEKRITGLSYSRHTVTGGDGEKKVITEAQLQLSLAALGSREPTRQTKSNREKEIVPVSALSLTAFRREKPKLYWPGSTNGMSRGRELTSSETLTGPNPLPVQDSVAIGHTAHSFVVSAKFLTEAGEEDYLAVKIIPCDSNEERDAAHKEMQLLREIQHNHIIATVGSFVKRQPDGHDEFGMLLYPLALMNLESLLRTISTHNRSRVKDVDWKPHESINRLISYFACLCDAVMYLHRRHIKHRDIKPSNILIDQHQNVVLADFSIAKKYGNRAAGITSGPSPYTLRYAPRNVIHKDRRGFEWDVFSLGCVFLETTTVIMGSTLDEMQSHLMGQHQGKEGLVFSEALEEGRIDSFLRQLLRVSTVNDLLQELHWSPQYAQQWLDTVRLMLGAEEGGAEVLTLCSEFFKSARAPGYNCPHCINAPKEPTLPSQVRSSHYSRSAIHLLTEWQPFEDPSQPQEPQVQIRRALSETPSTLQWTAASALPEKRLQMHEAKRSEIDVLEPGTSSTVKALETADIVTSGIPGQQAVHADPAGHRNRDARCAVNHLSSTHVFRLRSDGRCEAQVKPMQKIIGTWVLVLHRKFELVRAAMFSGLGPPDIIIELRRSFATKIQQPNGTTFDLKHLASKRINYLIGFGLVKLFAVFDTVSSLPTTTEIGVQRSSVNGNSNTMMHVPHRTTDYPVDGGLGGDQAQQDDSGSPGEKRTSSDLSFESHYKADVGNTDALLDPRAHFSSVKDLEVQVARLCGIRSLFAEDVERSSFSLMRHLNLEVLQKSCLKTLECLLEAIELLKDRRMLSNTYTIFIDDRASSDTINTLSITEKEIRELLSAVKNSGSTPVPLRDLPTPKAFNPELLDRVAAHDQGFLVICAVLCLGLVSYAGAHCSNLLDHMEAYGTKSPVTQSAASFEIGDKSLNFRRRRLACLDRFVGGPVWSFSWMSMDHLPPAKLRISLKDLSELWGPLYAIPSVKSFDSLIAIQTEAGVLTKAESGSGRALDNEVHLTWSPLRSTGVASTIHEATRNLAIPMEFDPKLLLCIGHSSRPASLNGTAPHANGKLVGMTLRTPRHYGLRHNSGCEAALDRVAKRNRGELHTVGTYDTHLVPDAITTAVSGGKFVSVAQGLSFKFRPGTKRKEQLVLFCQDPNMINAVMSSLDGLEMSACSGNAQRLSLRETLKLAFPSVTDFDHRSTYSKEEAEAVLKWLTYLKDTGLDHKDRLQCFLPSMSLPTVFRCDAKAPSWTAILQDTSDSACFATLSRRCLTYHGKDRMSHSRRIVKVSCSKRRNAPILSREIVFFTRLNLDERGVRGSGSDTETESTTGAVIPMGQEIRLHCGTLTVRNEQASGQLAYFSADLLIVRKIPGRRTGIVHRELLDMQTASSNTVPIFISDPPQNAILAAMHRRFGNDG